MQLYNDNKAAILMYLDNNKIIEKTFRASDRSLQLTAMCSRRIIACPMNFKNLISHRSSLKYLQASRSKNTKAMSLELTQ